MKTLLLTFVLLTSGFSFADDEQRIPVQETPSPAVVSYDVTGSLRTLSNEHIVGFVHRTYQYRATRDKTIILQKKGMKESASARPYFNKYFLAIKDNHTQKIIYSIEISGEEFVEKWELFKDASAEHPVIIQFDTEAKQIIDITNTRPEF